MVENFDGAPFVIVSAVPPTSAPAVPVKVTPAPAVSDEVATDESAFVPFPYTSCDEVKVV